MGTRLRASTTLVAEAEREAATTNARKRTPAPLHHIPRADMAVREHAKKHDTLQETHQTDTSNTRAEKGRPKSSEETQRTLYPEFRALQGPARHRVEAMTLEGQEQARKQPGTREVEDGGPKRELQHGKSQSHLQDEINERAGSSLAAEPSTAAAHAAWGHALTSLSPLARPNQQGMDRPGPKLGSRSRAACTGARASALPRQLCFDAARSPQATPHHPTSHDQIQDKTRIYEYNRTHA